MADGEHSDHEKHERTPYVARDKAIGDEYQQTLGKLRSSAVTRQAGVLANMTPQRFAAEGAQPALHDVMVTDLPVRRKKKVKKVGSAFTGTPTGDDLASWKRAQSGDTMLSTSELSSSSADSALAGPAPLQPDQSIKPASTSMLQLQPEFDQLGIHDTATSSKEIRVYGDVQLPDVIQYLPTEHKLALERFRKVPNHKVCIAGTYLSTQKGKFRTQKARMHIIGKTGRVIRDARG